MIFFFHRSHSVGCGSEPVGRTNIRKTLGREEMDFDEVQCCVWRSCHLAMVCPEAVGRQT